MYGGVHIWLSGNKASFTMHSFTVVPNPNANDVRRVVEDATFPVVLPVGLPKGMHMDQLIFSPAAHPNFIQITFRNARTDVRSGQFLLSDSSTVTHGQAPLLPSREWQKSGHVTQWTAGKETVIVFGRGDYSEIRAAMLRTTPAASLAQTLPRLYRIAVLGGQDKLADLANVIAPQEGRSALVDREHLSKAAMLGRAHKPLSIFRKIMINSYPAVAGKPDWAHVKQSVVREVVVSAGGVRALAAVLASGVCGNAGKMGNGFTCEMLINERRGQAYWVWVLPRNSSTPPSKYVVDPTTFRLVRRTE